MHETRIGNRWRFLTAGDHAARIAACSFAALVALAVYAVWHPIRESDPFWHLSQGRAVLAQMTRTPVEKSAFLYFEQPLIAPEWLWDILTYGIYSAWGYPGLSLLVMALAALAVYCLWSMLRASDPEAPPVALAMVATLVTILILTRLRLRPQAAFMAILPAFIALSYHCARAGSKRRGWLIAATVALQLIWAQTHGSFVLGPAIAVIIAAPSLLHPSATARRRTLLGLLLALLVASLTSAHGTSVVSYILEHSGTDAARHILDMQPPSWSVFNPSQYFYGPLYLGLVLLCMIGMAHARRVWWTELGLAVLGAALGLTAIRFFAAGGILAAPLALRALSSIWRELPRWHLAPAACTLALLTATLGQAHIRRVDHKRGPMGETGPQADRFAEGAASYLQGLPQGTRALTDYGQGAALGFWLDGHIRTYVDARTPVFFDDTHMAVARDVSRNPRSLELAVAHFDLGAAVVDRNQRVCLHLQHFGWKPVVIEARTTTFLPPSSDRPPLTELQACGAASLAPQVCDNPAKVRAELDAMEALAPSAYYRYLRADLALRCEGQGRLSKRLLPAADDSRAFRLQRKRLAAKLDIEAKNPGRALNSLAEQIAAGDIQAWRLVRPAIEQLPIARVRPTLSSLLTTLDDNAPPDLHLDMARICAAQRDAVCARFHAFRAADQGIHQVRPVLQWLAKHHPHGYARRESIRWFETLDEQQRLQIPEQAHH